jgi:uncharacterized protein
MPLLPSNLSTAQLLGAILTALLLQVGIGIGLVMWRRQLSGAVEASTRPTPSPAQASSAAWTGTRAFRVVSRRPEDIAQSQCSFVLQPLDGVPLPAFKPGQYLTFVLEVPDAAADGGTRSVTRCYSLSDAPAADHYRVSIKRVPSPPDHPEWPAGVSSNHFHDQVQVGSVLQVKAPSGHFFLDPDAAVPAVLVAGGIGITPMMSMLRWCVQQQPGRRVHLYYGLRNGAEHAFKAVLEDIAATHPQVHLHVVYSRPGPDDVQGRDHQHTGYIDIALLKRTLPHGRHQFYLCGPPALMESLVPALAAWGAPDEDVHFEAFGPASVRRKPHASSEPAVGERAPFDVRFARSGRTLSWDGSDANLLDFAERHGVAVDSGCRAGSCGTCQARCLEGVVSYLQPPDCEVTPGHGLLCVGRPEPGLVLEA